MRSFNKLVSKPRLAALALAISQTMALSPLMVLADDDSVRVAGKSVFQVQSGGSANPETIQKNLDNALVAANDRSGSSVQVVYVKGIPVITLGGYSVVTVDDAIAKGAGTTPAILAQKWASSLRSALADSASISEYVAQLSGSANSPAPMESPGRGAYPASYEGAAQPAPGGYGDQCHTPYQGRAIYAPAGLTIPAALRTSISTNAARPGDLIEAALNGPVDLGGGNAIPAGSVLIGQVTNARSSGRFEKSGELAIKFNRLRTPDGAEVPISAHICGNIGNYKSAGSDGSVKGEGMTAKFGQAAIRGVAGAGLGAALGTAVGAISGYGFGPSIGRGAWSGTAIGGGLGLADSLVLRKGRDVNIPSGTQISVQLDSPATLSATAQPTYGTF